MEFIQARIQFASKYLPLYSQGLGVTISISLLGILFGTILGTLVSLMRMSKRKWLRGISLAYVEVIRGTPMLVQLSLLYFTLITQIPPEMKFLRSKLLIATIAISLNSAAYVSEVIRSGIKSIDYGQTEAARSLGMTESQTMKHIILPQAVKNILPALGNEFVTLIKESAIVSFIALHDIMYYANAIQGATYKPFEPFFMAAVIYFIMTFGTSRLVGVLERKLDASDSRS